MRLHYKLILAVVLIAAPLAVRWAWFHRGSYTPPVIAEIDESQIAPAQTEYQVALEEAPQYEGRVLFDLAHNNNLEINDLVPLRNRLESRGLTVVDFEAESGGSLETELRGVTALVVVAPTAKYTPDEQNLIKAFVDDGGRLLLIADPTRPVPIPDEEVNLFTLSFPTSSTPAINSLANVFGILYFDDYLYNIIENEGNYRNVKFTDLNSESPLTQDLEEVVFFASHSLRSDGIPLVSGDENTLSPARRGETGLTAAAVSADEQVLALGDITFLTPSFHTIADNDRFVSRIADWLAGAERRRDLEDFPYLFEGPVDLVQVTGDYLDPRLIAGTGDLQKSFERAGLTLTVQAKADPAHDALFVGTFEDTERVRAHLATAGISITLTLTQTEEVTAASEAEPSPTQLRPTAASTATVTGTATVTATATPTATRQAPEAAQTPGAGPAANAAPTSEPESSEGLIEIEGLGAVQTRGTSLFIVDREGQRAAVTALAEDGESLTAALKKLAAGDLAGCVVGDPVTVCSTGVVEDTGPDTESSGSAPLAGGSRLFILSVDNWPEGSRTSILELQAILGTVYDVTAWSTSLDGVPTAEDLEGYDAYLVDSGDYAYNLEDTETLAGLNGLTSPVMFIGEQPFPSFDPEPAEISDLQVSDVSHPIAFGLEADQVITLAPAESGVAAVIIPPAQGVYDDANVVFTRGPGSAEAGRPAVIGATEARSGRRVILATFAFYRLPQDIQRTFALNAVKWLLE